jgi:hypothetical protein
MRQFAGSKKYGKADFLFWWNEKGDAVVTFRLEGRPAGAGKWITGHRKLFPNNSVIPLTDSQFQ